MKREKHKRDPLNFDTKWCPKCQMMKSFDDFGSGKSNYDGLAKYCKICARAYYDKKKTEKKANKPKFF